MVKTYSDPAQAFQHWVERDMRFALRVGQQAERLGLRVLVVDGSLSIKENTALGQAHLGLFN